MKGKIKVFHWQNKRGFLMSKCMLDFTKRDHAALNRWLAPFFFFFKSEELSNNMHMILVYPQRWCWTIEDTLSHLCTNLLHQCLNSRPNKDVSNTFFLLPTSIQAPVQDIWGINTSMPKSVLYYRLMYTLYESIYTYSLYYKAEDEELQAIRIYHIILYMFWASDWW